MSLPALLLVGLVLIGGCATSADSTSIGSGEPLPVSVFYGTDRGRDQADDPDRFYGGQRGVAEYGVVEVELLPGSVNGRLLSVQPQPGSEFIDSIRSALGASASRSLLVFVHGYNRSFSQIARLAAEFVHHIDFEGVPVIWSWPSLRNPASYLEDRNNMNWSRADFSHFLAMLLNESGAESVHLMGHSMGSQVLVDSLLVDLLEGEIDTRHIGEVVLLAPDIDREIFTRDMAPRLAGEGLKLTLYVSDNDRAMASSRAINGYPRAGDSSDGPVIVHGVETVDASDANRSILGHSYFEESETVMQDLGELLNHRIPAAGRSRLNAHRLHGAVYWKMEGG